MIFFIHYFLHLVFPLLPARIFYPKNYGRVYGIFLLTMLVDADHLLASPIYDPNRCSIGFHPLHSYAAIVIYLLLMLPSRSRIVAIGLLMHMGTDWLDCYFSGNYS
jgi:Family of unknown function (DUF6122)